MQEATLPTVSTRADGRVTVVTIERPARRNAVDLMTARALFDAFKSFDANAAAANEIAWGLKTLASGEASAGSARFKGGAGRHGRPADGTDENSAP